jgi:hypothetical protein
VNDYRIYILDSDGHVVGPSQIIFVETDEEAMARAKQFLNNQSLEVWLGPKLIGRLDPG